MYRMCGCYTIEKLSLFFAYSTCTRLLLSTNQYIYVVSIDGKVSHSVDTQKSCSHLRKKKTKKKL